MRPTSGYLLASAFIVGGALAAPHAAQSAETYHTCAGFIDSVPATITKQGVWCLRKDLATANTSGSAITINANNVTVDCNGFKIGGLAAGNGSEAYGIYADERQNTTVRNCSVRGFSYGVSLSGAGHLVEDNRLDNNLRGGIFTGGDNTTVIRNRVHDTGGAIGASRAIGIEGTGDAIDNIVSGLFADRPGGSLRGIYVWGDGTVISGNRVGGFDMRAREEGRVGAVYGVYLAGDGQRAASNHVIAPVPSTGTGIHSAPSSNFCIDNTVAGFAESITSNCIRSGNLTTP